MGIRRTILWNLSYLLGRTPWDSGVTPPEVRELVESGALRPGRALDVGCGTGTNAVYLARHGFEVVGVDVAALAVRRARRRAREAGVVATFHTAGVLDLGSGRGPRVGTFDLALDIGCLHSLAPPDRARYAEMLRRVIRPGGSYLLYAWGPREMLGRQVGITPEETQALAAPHFQTAWVKAGEERGSSSYWYLFERGGAPD